jgi:hypothetical protein
VVREEVGCLDGPVERIRHELGLPRHTGAVGAEDGQRDEVLTRKRGWSQRQYVSWARDGLVKLVLEPPEPGEAPKP